MQTKNNLHLHPFPSKTKFRRKVDIGAGNLNSNDRIL